RRPGPARRPPPPAARSARSLLVLLLRTGQLVFGDAALAPADWLVAAVGGTGATDRPPADVAGLDLLDDPLGARPGGRERPVERPVVQGVLGWRSEPLELLPQLVPQDALRLAGGLVAGAERTVEATRELEPPELLRREQVELELELALIDRESRG